jgi:O-antigen/teichoic acid export membrane protein
MGKGQVKIGALLSYLLIILNSVYGLIITPYILGKIGPSEYGVYKTIGSLTGTILILDLGIGGTLQRYTAKFKAEGYKNKIENFFSMGIIQSIILSLVIGFVCFNMYLAIKPIYSSSFTKNELARASQLFIILSINVILHVFENVIQGVISGLNQFVFTNGLKLCSLVIRGLLLFLILPVINNSIAVVCITLVIDLIIIIIELLYLYLKLNIRIKFYYWDKPLFLESFKYTLMLFVQSIVSQVNSNLDNVVIGAVIGAEAVAIYSFGLLIFNMFQQLSTSLSSVMLPTVINIIHSGANNIQLENLVIKVGRIQFMLMGAALSGFLILGQEFISLWLGNGFQDVWIITLILMFPAIWELSQNVCLAILRANNMLKFRTIVLIATTIVNLIITIIGTQLFGYFAAALGTAISIIIGSLIIMNIYYYKVLKLNPVRIFMDILDKTLICLIISSIILAIINYYIYGSWIAFCIKVLIFCLTYGILLLAYEFNKERKGLIFKLK